MERMCVALLSLLLAGEAVGQIGVERVVDPEKALRKQAMRLIRALELPSKRAAAAPKLLLLGKKAMPSLIRALDDPRPEVVSRLALVLRILGDDAQSAIPTLRRIAKDKDEKLASAGRWALAAFEPVGITLVTESGPRSAFEVNAKRELSFTVPSSKNAFAAERLPNGNYLVAILNRNVVEEIDRKGKVHWKVGVKSPTSVCRLPSGNTLITGLVGKAVIEVDPKGKTVWAYECKNPYSAERLANGNTLITSYGQGETLEVTPDGEVAWSYKELAGPLEAQRLSNGNTLIAGHTGRAVHEVTPKGKVVLKIGLPGNVWSARRLPNGNTLAGGANFLICFDKKGKEKWRYKKVKTVTCIRYY
jgi:hypothetical protein